MRPGENEIDEDRPGLEGGDALEDRLLKMVGQRETVVELIDVAVGRQDDDDVVAPAVVI